MTKIEGIKKVSKTKYINVDDQTKKSHVDVHIKNTDIHKEIINIKKETTRSILKDVVKDQLNPKKFNVVFMGTGKFAENILKEIFIYANKRVFTKFSLQFDF